MMNRKVEHSGIRVTPQPAGSTLTIHGTSASAQIRLIDLFGATRQTVTGLDTGNADGCEHHSGGVVHRRSRPWVNAERIPVIIR